MSESIEQGHLIVIRRAPYSGGLARAAIDAALAAAAFDQKFDILFLGNGVLQLVPEQESHSIGVRNLHKHISALPLYGVDRIYIDGTALKQYNIPAQIDSMDVTVLDEPGIRKLLSLHRHILGF